MAATTLKPWRGFVGTRTYSPELRRDLDELDQFLKDLRDVVGHGLGESTSNTTITNVTASTEVIAGVGLDGGGNLASDVTIDLANTAVTPGSYTLASLTVDQQGRLTAASSGTISLSGTTGRYPKFTSSTGIGDSHLAEVAGATYIASIDMSGLGANRTYYLEDPGAVGGGTLITGSGTMGYLPVFETQTGFIDSGITWDANAGLPLVTVQAFQFFVGIDGGVTPEFIFGENASSGLKMSRDDSTGDISIDIIGASVGEVHFLCEVSADNHLTIGNAKNLIFNTGTGTKLGTATGQKLSLWNKSPIIQPAAALQAAITNSTGGSQDGTLVDVTTAGLADPAKINSNFTDIYALLDAMRTAMVDFGSMKGSA